MSQILLRDLSPGTAYSIQVRAVNNEQTSEWSPLYTVVTNGDSLAPAAPTALTWTFVGTALSGTWTAPTTNTDGSTLKDFKDFQVTLTANSKSVVVYTTQPRYDLTFEQNKNMFGTPQATVQISVAARDLSGNVSAAVTATATNAAPATPTGFTATGLNEAISVTWNANTDDDLDHYEVYMSTVSGFTPGPTNLIWSGRATSANIATAANYSAEYLAICAVDAFGTKSAYATASATPKSSFTADTTAPAQPTGLAVTGALDPKDSKNLNVIATVTWTQTAVSDLAGFTIRYRRTGDTNWYTYDVTDGSSRAATISGLAAGTSYDFQIKSYDFSGNTAGFTATATMAAVSDSSAPAQVAGVTLTPSQNAITASWTENSETDVKNGAGTYEVQIDTANTFNTANLKTYKTGANSITISGLATATTYYIRVRAVDASGNTGAYSVTASATTTTFPTATQSDGTPPASSPAANVLGTIGNLYVYWTAVANADLVTYEVHISTTTGFTPSSTTKVAETMGTFITLEKDAAGVDLAYGTTYYVRLIAKDRDGAAAAGTQGSGSPVKAGTADISTVSGAQVKDGSPPASSPAANVSGGLGYLFVYWNAVANNDPVTYEVHVSTTTGFTPSSATKAMEVTDTSAFVRTLPGSNTALSYGTTYYVRIVAKDADGAAAAGTQGSGVPGKVTASDSSLTAVDVGANKVTYSTAAPGTTANNAGDVWFVRDATSGNITAQYEGGGGTTWTQRKIDTLAIASIAAGQIATGTLSAVTITIPATGDIRSADYVAGSAGFKLTSGGLEIRSGSIAANTLVSGTISAQTIQVASTGSIQSTDYASGTAGWKLSTTGLEINSGIVRANTIQSGTGIVNNLIVNTGGGLQSSNYNATNKTGWTLNSTGLTIYGGSVAASTLTTGTITAQAITVAGGSGAGASIIVDQYGEIRSNNWAAGSTGFRLYGGGAGAASLEINSGSIKAEAFAGGTFSAGKLITLGDATTDGVIQSYGYAAGSAGFKLSKTGLEINQGTISAAALLLQAGENILPPEYADFEFQSTFYSTAFVTANAPTITVDATVQRFNSQSLKVVAGATSPTVDFTPSATTYNIPMEGSSTYIVSMYVQHTAATAQNVNIRFKDSATAVQTSANLSVPNGTAWTRVTATFTSAATATSGWIGVQIPASTTFYIDGVQVEKKTSGTNSPSSWMPPSTTSINGGMIKTGSIQSTNLVTMGQSSGSQPAWSISLTGSASFANAFVRGHLIVGDATGNGLLSDQYIASGNYQPGSAGYIIKGDGSVEFNSGTFRGTVSIGTNPGAATTGSYIQMDTTNGLFMGAGDAATAPFSVSMTGFATLSNATFTTSAGAGTSGTLTIGPSGLALTDANGNTNFALSTSSGAVTLQGNVMANSLTVGPFGTKWVGLNSFTAPSVPADLRVSYAAPTSSSLWTSTTTTGAGSWATSGTTPNGTITFTNSTTTANYRAMQYLSSTNTAMLNAQVVGQFTTQMDPDSADPNEVIHLAALRMSSTDDTFYSMDLIRVHVGTTTVNNAWVAVVNKYVNGVKTNLGSWASSPKYNFIPMISVVANKTYYYKFVVQGSNLYAYLWDGAGTPQPTLVSSGTDSSPLPAGGYGFGYSYSGTVALTAARGFNWSSASNNWVVTSLDSTAFNVNQSGDFWVGAGDIGSAAFAVTASGTLTLKGKGMTVLNTPDIALGPGPNQGILKKTFALTLGSDNVGPLVFDNNEIQSLGPYDSTMNGSSGGYPAGSLGINTNGGNVTIGAQGYTVTHRGGITFTDQAGMTASDGTNITFTGTTYGPSSPVVEINTITLPPNARCLIIAFTRATVSAGTLWTSFRVRQNTSTGTIELDASDDRAYGMASGAQQAGVIAYYANLANGNSPYYFSHQVKMTGTSPSATIFQRRLQVIPLP